MRRFRFRAATAEGKLVSGIVAGSSASEADAVLLRRGLHPVGLEESNRESTASLGHGRQDLAVVFRSLAALVGAGVSLERALSASEALPRRQRLRESLSESRRLLHEGLGLSEALEAAGADLPSTVVGVLKAGERGGALAAALDRIATQLEQESEMAGRVRSALAYPVVLAMTGLLSVVVMTTVIIPRFAVILRDLHQELPLSTRILLDTAAFLERNGPLLFMLAATVAVLGARWAQSIPGRSALDSLTLRLPLIGGIRHSFAAARLSHALGGMLSSGMPLLPALDAAGEALGDLALRRRLELSRGRVAQGESLGAAFTAEAVLPAAALQLVMVGDQSGQVALMLGRAGDLAGREAEQQLRTLVSVLEPGLVIAFGAMVAFVAAALLQAVYSLRPGV